jgi:hypothetical protein
MRHAAKVKTVAVRVPLRKAAMSASAASRHGFPAWIDAGERGVAFNAATVVPRVRDGLVLRVVGKKQPIRSRSLPDAHGAR